MYAKGAIGFYKRTTNQLFNIFLRSFSYVEIYPSMPKKLYLIRVRLDRPNTQETLDANQNFFETSASNGRLI